MAPSDGADDERSGQRVSLMKPVSWSTPTGGEKPWCRGGAGVCPPCAGAASACLAACLASIPDQRPPTLMLRAGDRPRPAVRHRHPRSPTAVRGTDRAGQRSLSLPRWISAAGVNRSLDLLVCPVMVPLHRKA